MAPLGAGALPLLEEQKLPKLPEWGKSLADFDGTSFGPEYLSFKEGEELGVFKAKEAAGWAYGVLKSDQEGWFPPDFWSPKGANQLAPPRTCGLHIAADREEAKGPTKAAPAAPTPAPTAETVLADGVVKIFFPERRYGFIDCNGLDVFLHLSDCGQHTPRVGDMVKFTVERRASNPKQLQAKSVQFDGHQTFVQQNQKGEVKSVSSGHGFIVSDAGSDVFFRMASCNGMPMPGDAVTFDVKWSEVRPGMLEAVNVCSERAPDRPTSPVWKEKHPEIAVVKEFATVVTQLAERAEGAEAEVKTLAEKLEAAEKRIQELTTELETLKGPTEQTPERTR